jgi:hypothetical protein
MEEERFEELAEIIEQRHRDKTENWVLAEARRAREAEEGWKAEAHAKRETLRADHAELIADMYKAETEKAEADLVALKAENTRLREIVKEYLICGVESANKHYELVQVPRSLIADARAALGGGA